MSLLSETAIELLLAVVVASVMGSLHCVGMCGPFALWASGAGAERAGGRGWFRGGVLARVSLYHLGRLTTYLVGGALVGAAGMAVSAGGSWLGFQSAAARVAGGVMVVLGAVRFWHWFRQRSRARKAASSGAAAPVAVSGSSASAGWIARRLASFRPALQRLPGTTRAYAIGGLTTLLPCGWLYLFLIVAGGTGSIASAMSLMVAFWIGTLPALTSLMLGALRVAPAIRPALPLLGSLLLLGTGLYTATGRASADLSVLSERAAALEMEPTASSDPAPAETLEVLADEPLPCCSRGE